jgi:nicotinate-nucleotide pyrophosphorylase (carboxylating)
MCRTVALRGQPGGVGGQGRAQALLSAERTALNFLQLLSAVATKTATYVAVVAGTRAHRGHPQNPAGPAPGAKIRGALRRRHQPPHGPVRRRADQRKPHCRGGWASPRCCSRRQGGGQASFVEIEVETLEQLQRGAGRRCPHGAAGQHGLPTLREAVRINAGRAILEISGGVTLDGLRALAETGVDRISIGTLTKDVKATDYSMRFDALCRPHDASNPTTHHKPWSAADPSTTSSPRPQHTQAGVCSTATPGPACPRAHAD